MVGGTLRDIRAEIQSLSCPDGDYEVVCGRSGIAPSAVAGLAFPDRLAAGEAADLAGTYRATLRRYDPSIPFDDPLVHEVSPTPIPPLATTPEDKHTRYTLFCHDIAGAVFESLSALGHREVESAAMETYLTLAEVVGDESDFCLTMVWSLMSEMDVRLSVAEQTAIVEHTAELFAPVRTPNPVGATLRLLESVGFLEGYSVRPVPTGEREDVNDDRDRTTGERDEPGVERGGDERRCWELTFGEYALAERTGRIPTLPIAIDLLRRVRSQSVQFVEGEALSDSRWRLCLETCQTGSSDGLVSVEVAENRWLNDTGLSLHQD
ncbi:MULTISPECIES: hypothetical protein [Haloferax]|uniref:Uncharacterized protein n=1 Tax=Haloferax marinum TaxID=2666143 RepID=A0A6A8G4L6_9EURY|nr:MULTISPECIES: hypothetical protein [Haloferax]KAB1196717.1 hypothetical protein Hfx1150_03950 [Haloferax sp. CBA1150]MRW95725.1 hypothetical protein [Haloferax marinum]